MMVTPEEVERYVAFDTGVTQLSIFFDGQGVVSHDEVSWPEVLDDLPARDRSIMVHGEEERHQAILFGPALHQGRRRPSVKIRSVVDTDDIRVAQPLLVVIRIFLHIFLVRSQHSISICLLIFCRLLP